MELGDGGSRWCSGPTGTVEKNVWQLLKGTSRNIVKGEAAISRRDVYAQAKRHLSRVSRNVVFQNFVGTLCSKDVRQLEFRHTPPLHSVTVLLGYGSPSCCSDFSTSVRRVPLRGGMMIADIGNPAFSSHDKENVLSFLYDSMIVTIACPAASLPGPTVDGGPRTVT